MVGNSNDVANVPVGAGLSAAICLREGLIYLKTIQNGSPMLLGYKLCPLEGNQSTPEQNNLNQNANAAIQSQPPISAQTAEQKILKVLEDFETRLKNLENGNKSKGGPEKWQL